jgi:two-component system, chemotaxis family, sensor kinase CheA
MDRNKLIERLMATFLGELEEHVRTFNEVLLSFEKEPESPDRAEGFKTILRVAHSLKGASRSVGITAIEEACHRVEEILASARDGRRPLDADRFALLFATADAIEEAGMRLREQRDLADSPLAALLPRLDMEASAASASPMPPARSPASPPPVSAPARPTSPRPAPAPTPAPPPTPTAIPPATATAAAPTAPPPVATPPRPVPVEPERPTLGSAFVRIPAQKLDDMLTSSGELLVARRGVELRAEERATIRDFVAHWRADWHGAEKAIGKFLREKGGRGDGPSFAGTIPRHAAETIARVGEQLGRLEHDLDRFFTSMAAGERQLDRAARRIDDEVRRVRMLPFAEACQGLERSVRDVANTEGKRAELVIEGGDVEIDRSVLEGLRDPLNHLVRNAVDHGLERPDIRRAAGKSETGRVTVSASLRGSQVEVVVADDGRGLDLEAVRAEAKGRGFGETTDAPTLADLIFLPGFSTAKMVTAISGRGVGLDVVKSRLEVLHGSVELSIEPGRGTRFTMAVPLTFTSQRALLVAAGGQTFALASASVLRLLRVEPGELRTIEGRAMLVRDGAPLPIVELARVLGLAPRDPAIGPEPAPVHRKRPVLIVASGERRVALLVDELITEQEIIVKRLGDRIKRVRNVAGATILPTGQIAPVLNPSNLVRSALNLAPVSASPVARPPDDRPEASGPPTHRHRLLVVDDSVTTRTLEKSILEAAGYDVLTAVDGDAGWRILQEQGADLVVTDIEMPRMDGFALTETIRRSSRFADLPVILLSSLASDRDRARGIEAGADAYIVKGGFDQNDLIKTIEQLL